MVYHAETDKWSRCPLFSTQLHQVNCSIGRCCKLGICGFLRVTDVLLAALCAEGRTDVGMRASVRSLSCRWRWWIMGCSPWGMRGGREREWARKQGVPVPLSFCKLPLGRFLNFWVFASVLVKWECHRLLVRCLSGLAVGTACWSLSSWPCFVHHTALCWGGPWDLILEDHGAATPGGGKLGNWICQPTAEVEEDFWIGVRILSHVLALVFSTLCIGLVPGTLFLSHLSKYSVLSPTSLGSCWSTSLSYKLLSKYEFHLEVESVTCLRHHPWHIKEGIPSVGNDDLTSGSGMWSTQQRQCFLSQMRWSQKAKQRMQLGTYSGHFWNKGSRELLANRKGTWLSIVV